MPRSTDEGGERTGPDPVEGRGRQVKEPSEDLAAATPSPSTVEDRLRRIATLVEKAQGRPFTTLAHHVDEDWLRAAYARTRKDGAPGIDGVTSKTYAENLPANLRSLLARVRADTYRPPPVRGVDIPKGDGKSTRPLGIPTFEDKVFQRAVVMLLEPLYEPEFHPDSYGFRPGKSAHQALAALRDCLHAWGGGWVLEVDIRKFFDMLDHDHLMALLQHKVRDGKVLEWIRRWLKAGVAKDGALSARELGTPQGGVISPLLANIYLHYVLDLWFEQDVRPRLRGRARLIRYADDFVIVMDNESDTTRVMDVLPKRFGRYGLTLHPDKTKLVPFHRPPHSPGRENYAPPPGSFDLLGHTHRWERSKKGGWCVRQTTASSRLTRALNAIREWCRDHRHEPLRDQHAALSAKIRGHFMYFGNPGNMDRLWEFSRMAFRGWVYWLARRSQKVNWERLIAATRRLPLPIPRVNPNLLQTAAKP